MNENSKKAVCTYCRGETQFLGQIPLRTGGSSGASHFIFGVWAELGEDVVAIEMFRCVKCGHIELFDLDSSLPVFSKGK